MSAQTLSHKVPDYKNIQLPTAILFDWDDTIIETWPRLYEIYQEVFAKYNTPLPNSHEMHEIAVRQGRQYTIDQIGEHALKDLIDIYDETFHKSMTILPGAKEMLDFLRAQNIPLGIVSNKEHDTLNSEVKILGLTPYFDQIIGRCVKAPKPSPDGVFHALESMKISPSKNVWFIGDSIVDHETARNSRTFSVVYGHAEHEGDLGVTNWNQFTRILETIFSNIC